MIVQADGGRYAFDTDPGHARSALDTIATTGREALEDMRRLVGVLRGSGVQVAPTPRQRAGLAQLAAFAGSARSAGLAVTLDVGVADDDLPATVGLTVTRLVQEALTNSLRHAGPGAHATVRVSRDHDAVVMSCVDDGGGRPATAPPAGGHGLVGMRERVAVHSGTIEAGPAPGGGWTVKARIPLPAPGWLAEPAAAA
jgi:signal transduction histidine kinase